MKIEFCCKGMLYGLEKQVVRIMEEGLLGGGVKGYLFIQDFGEVFVCPNCGDRIEISFGVDNVKLNEE